MSFDPNAFYKLATVSSNHTGALRWCDGQTVCFSDKDTTDASAQWQLITINASSLSTTSANSQTQTSIGPLSIVNRKLGSGQALAVSASGNTTNVSFKPLAVNDGAQQWNVVVLGNSTNGEQIWLFETVANGTKLNLQATNQVVTMAQESFLSGPDQGWTITQLNGTSSTPDVNSNGHHLSAGDIAGIVIGAVGGIALIALAILFLLRRRKREDHHHDDNDDSYRETTKLPMEPVVASPPSFPRDEKKDPLLANFDTSASAEDRVELSNDRDQGYNERHEMP